MQNAKTPTQLFLLLGLILSLQSVYAKGPIPASKLLRCLPLSETLATGYLSPKLKNSSAIKDLEKEIKGLNAGGVVAWEPKEINDLNRKLVRYHGVNELADPIPAFDKTQKLGPAKVQAEEIRFSQLGCKNESEGGYTVIDNARSLKEGTLKLTQLPKLRVWRDTKGNIWTLDHRRLAAMKLSGVVKELEVEFVAEDIVRAQRFKFDTKTQGQSIMVRVERPGKDPLAIIVMDQELTKAVVASKSTKIVETSRASGSEETFQKLIQRYPASQRDQWLQTRGEEHFDKLKGYAKELSDSFAALERATKGSIVEAYSHFGEVSMRGKAEGSILAKLLRKDFDEFNKGTGGITSLKKAVAGLGDSIGTRLTLTADSSGKISPQDVQRLVDKLSEEITNGLGVTEIMNYRARGADGLPYLTEAQVQQLLRASQEYRLKMQKLLESGKSVTVPEPIIVKTGPSASFETGYTSFHLNIKYPSGVQSEFQLRGKLMNEASEIQHFVYDIKSGKVLSERLKSNPAIISAERSYKALSPTDQKRVMDYVEKKLIYARQIETGLATGPPPQLASDLPKELSFEYLKPHLIHE